MHNFTAFRNNRVAVCRIDTASDIKKVENEGFLDERGIYSAHNPKVRFNEDVCPVGAA